MPEDIIREALKVLEEHIKFPYLTEEEVEAILNDAYSAIDTLVEETLT